MCSLCLINLLPFVFLDFLIFADVYLRTIFTIPISTTTQIAQPVIIPSKHSIQGPIAVEYDNRDGRLYWTDISEPAFIARTYLNGSEFQVIHSDIGVPEGIAIDKIDRKMYWTDRKRKVIEVSQLDGTSRKVLIQRSSLNLRDIQVDNRNRYTSLENFSL